MNYARYKYGKSWENKTFHLLMYFESYPPRITASELVLQSANVAV